jgi:hypothetical protein
MRIAIILAALLLPSVAFGQATVRCDGQAWADIAADRFDEPRLGPLLALFNGKAETERCEEGRFVRLPLAIPHQVQLGQTMKAIAARFTRGAGGEALLRAENGLPDGTEPATDQALKIPAEIEYAAGSRPEAELAAIFGMPPIETIKSYNGLAASDPFTPGGTIYVPVFLVLKPKAAPPPPPPPPVAVITTDKVRKNALIARFDRFKHESHVAILGAQACAGCHPIDPTRAGHYLPVEPTACANCHAGFEATEAVARTDRLLLTFAHALHVDPARKVIKEDQYSTPCLRCHAAGEGGGVRALPSHAECDDCHNETEAKPVVSKDCAGCHATSETRDPRLLAKSTLHAHYRGSERSDDIFFGHAAHEKVIGAAPEQSCSRCHVRATKAETLADMGSMRMGDCLSCHRGLQTQMADEAVSLDRCRACHLTTIAGAAPVFESVLDKPLGHTRAFRRKHGVVARSDQGTCAACHVELAGESGANCQRCHQQIRPEDHGPRFRDESHGRAAIRDPDRCATCHQRERCADCHAEPPRDHFPRQIFQQRHATQARVSPRRCLTCHLPAADCARCHDVSTK